MSRFSDTDHDYDEPIVNLPEKEPVPGSSDPFANRPKISRSNHAWMTHDCDPDWLGDGNYFTRD